MSITLTHSGTTLELPDRLLWTDEFDWSPVAQSTGYSTRGSLLVDVGLKQGGRPITLDGKTSKAWIPRSLCVTLEAWQAIQDIEMTLVLRGVTRAVIWDHESTGFSASPVWKLVDSEHTSELLYTPFFRFLEV